jgi:hypothetical protein
MTKEEKQKRHPVIPRITHISDPAGPMAAAQIEQLEAELIARGHEVPRCSEAERLERLAQLIRGSGDEGT